MAEKKFPFDFMKAVQDVTNDTAEVRVDVINAGDIGGGTQYADGDAVATPTGSVALGHDGANVQALKTDSSGELQVDVLSVAGSVAVTNAGLTELAAAINASSQMDVNLAASNATVTVTGTVTANAGTNLNTSALLTTAAHDAAFGTAGTADTQVRSIQGIASMTPVQVGDNSSSLTVDNGGTFVVQENGAALTALQLIDNAVSGSGFNITQFAGVNNATGSGNATGALRVELANNGTGVLATVGTVTTVTTVTTCSTVTTLTGGGIAHDSTDSGNPHKIGGKAFSPDGTTPGTAVAENDRSDLKTDLNGRLFVNTNSPQMLSYHLDTSTAQTDTTVIADPGDGFQAVVTSIIFSTGSATACNIFFEEGASKVLGPWYLEAVAGRGVHWTGAKPITASTALTVTTSASIAQSLDVCYYLQAV